MFVYFAFFMRPFICFGIESTAHTAGVALVSSEGVLLADARHTLTTDSGGIIPLEASQHHHEYFPKLLVEVFAKSGLSFQDVSCIALSSSPGLAPCLGAGMKFAKELSSRYQKPLVGVHHVAAHLEIGKLLTDAKDPVFVFISGANTQIIAYEGGCYRVFGETLSLGLGNALDKFGRYIGLGFPAGPKIEELALQGSYVELPYTVKGMDVEFSGILTTAMRLYKNGVSKEDLCYSLQETFFSMVVEVCERALAHTGKSEALVIGGVGANKRFFAMLSSMCSERGAKAFVCPLLYVGDNASMIAWVGCLRFAQGHVEKDTFDYDPRKRVDDVVVDWL